ncbi:MAG: hypothetical protein KW802_04450 [Candidatus Doudnabacteria bacterium]|nr:hypothetical protein [Candidatus Doudnabacteria bacterium]
MIGTIRVAIRAGKEAPEDIVIIPEDGADWANQMRQLLRSDHEVSISASNTDIPGRIAVVFSPKANQVTHDPQDEMQEQSVFGFYINAATARELKALFGFIAAALESDRSS